MSDDRCLHDMLPCQCGVCAPRPGSIDVGSGRSAVGAHADASKQESLSHLCRLLGIAPIAIGVGSSVPSELFDALATRYGVPDGSMPEVGKAVVVRAGLDWGDDCDSRSSGSGGGSTVTGKGLERLIAAVVRLG